MSGEQTVIVQAPKANGEASSSDSKPPVEAAIDQAMQFGAMREAFHSTQTEVALIRSDLEQDKGNRAMLLERLDRLEQQQGRLLEALEREDEAEETEETSIPSSTTVIVPPALETPKEEETPPKAKQSWMSRALFGREDE